MTTNTLTSNLKIAIIMIGNMRSYNITFKKLDDCLFKQYQCDLYVFTYNKRFNIKGNPTNIREENITEENVRSVYGKYLKHVTIMEQNSIVEHYQRIANKAYKFGNDLDRLFTIEKFVMMSYDIFKGECVRNNRKYDVLFKIRPDILFTDKLTLLPINENQIVVPTNNSGGSFNDHMAYGKLKSMEKYFTYYQIFHEVDHMNDTKTCDVSIIEDGLKKNLDINKIEIIRIPFNYQLVRDTKVQKVVYVGKGQYFVKKYQ